MTLGPSCITVYAVIRSDGTIRRSRRSNHLMIYLSLKSAKTQATEDGDSVVAAEINLSSATPLFIRGEVLDVA